MALQSLVLLLKLLSACVGHMLHVSGDACCQVACRDLHYFVVVGAAAHKGRKADEGAKATEIDLLHSITGAFRPGVLTALMVCASAVEHCEALAVLSRHAS